jgi:hypothetical protein
MDMFCVGWKARTAWSSSVRMAGKEIMITAEANGAPTISEGACFDVIARMQHPVGQQREVAPPLRRVGGQIQEVTIRKLQM